MKIIRYQDKAGNIGYASQEADGSAVKLEGNLYEGLPQPRAQKRKCHESSHRSSPRVSFVSD